jgi:hypothetical protein
MSGLFFFCQRKMNHYKTRKIMNPGFRLVRLVQLFDLFRKATNMVLFCLDKFEDKTHFLIWVLKEENRNLVLEGMRTFIDCIFGKYRDHLYVLQNGFNEVRIEITPAQLADQQASGGIGSRFKLNAILILTVLTALLGYGAYEYRADLQNYIRKIRDSKIRGRPPG